MDKWYAKPIPLILTSISPQLREGIKTGLTEWDTKAKTTDNPWDDILVGLLRTITGL